MVARTVTHTPVGLEPRRVDVEAHVSNGTKSFAIVGLADRACQEAKHRVRSGIEAAELTFPKHRVTVNLAPADLRKEGPGFDFPIALAVLAATGQLRGSLDGHAAVGELGLDGRVRRVGGVLVSAEGARRSGIERLLCAAEAAPEAALSGVRPVPVRHLADAVAYLEGRVDPPAVEPLSDDDEPPVGQLDLADVRGQERARRALEIAAAGTHNLLLAGPPGTGKSMLARRLPGILPRLTDEEALEVTRIHSVAGLLPPARPLIRERPFRAPHHTASVAALVGGGSVLRPGEATLAHHGVLLLDEMVEFQRGALEALRQPLEDGIVSIARVNGRVVFPARFQLIGTMNMCPCGARGDPGAECSCSPQRLAGFRDKLSRALLDRFDLVVKVPRAPAEELAGPRGEASASVRERVVAARERLRERVPDRGSQAEVLLTRAVTRLGLSGRGRARVGRAAATIAALEGAATVLPDHVAEALAYRSPAELAAP